MKLLMLKFAVLIGVTITTPKISKANDVDPKSNKCDYSDDNQSPPANTCISNQFANRWKWNPDGNVCNITRMSRSELLFAFEGKDSNNLGDDDGKKGKLPSLFHEPVIIYPDDKIPNQHEKQKRRAFRHFTKREMITSQTFPADFQVTLTSSNAQSEHRRVSTLEEYVMSQERVEVFPNASLSNETWYLFGETFSQQWNDQLMKYYVLPPCQSCNNGKVSLSFGIGGRGSGVQWHTHGPGFSETIHGRKHWVLYPKVLDVKGFNKDLSSRHWMEEIYTSLDHHERPWECTVHPEEMIYFPDGWHHATINLDPYTVFVSSFTWEWDDA